MSDMLPQNATSGGNLTPPQEKALAALLSGKTVTAAAEAAGVDRTTVYRWLRDRHPTTRRRLTARRSVRSGRRLHPARHRRASSDRRTVRRRAICSMSGGMRCRTASIASGLCGICAGLPAAPVKHLANDRL